MSLEQSFEHPKRLRSEESIYYANDEKFSTQTSKVNLKLETIHEDDLV
jgi:hypothetical protein